MRCLWSFRGEYSSVQQLLEERHPQFGDCVWNAGRTDTIWHKGNCSICALLALQLTRALTWKETKDAKENQKTEVDWQMIMVWTGCWTASKMYKGVQRCKDVQSTKGSPGASIFRVSWRTMQKRNADSLLLSCVMWFGLLEQSGLGTSVFCLAFHSWNQESSWRFDVHAGYSGRSCVQPGFSLRRAESSSSLGSLWMSSNEERRNWLANKTVSSNKFKKKQEDTKHQKVIQ